MEFTFVRRPRKIKTTHSLRTTGVGKQSDLDYRTHHML